MIRNLALGSVALLLLVASASMGAAEGPVSTLRTESDTLNLSIDGNEWKGGWTLASGVDPHVLLIGSRLPYQSKRVAFSSGVDSVVFKVKPGSDYEFDVLREGEPPCRIRITALVNPSFWSTQTLASVGIGTWVVALVFAAGWQRMKPAYLLPFGIAAPLVFWGTTFLSGSRIDGYDHASNVISELGVVGAETEVLTSSAFVLVSLLSVLFSAGLYKVCRQRGLSTAPVWLSLSMPIGMFWAAVFPLGNELHGVLGPLPLLMNLAALLAFVLWRKREGNAFVSRLSLLSFGVMMLLFLIFVEPINGPYAGLVQRFWYAGWTLWFVSLSVGFMSTEARTIEEPQAYEGQQRVAGARGAAATLAG